RHPEANGVRAVPYGIARSPLRSARRCYPSSSQFRYSACLILPHVRNTASPFAATKGASSHECDELAAIHGDFALPLVASHAALGWQRASRYTNARVISSTRPHTKDRDCARRLWQIR